MFDAPTSIRTAMAEEILGEGDSRTPLAGDRMDEGDV